MRKIPLNCEACGNRNYNVPKQEGSATRLTLKKYCQNVTRTQFIKNRNKYIRNNTLIMCSKDLEVEQMAKKESFFKGVKSEMEKTSWPTKEELFKYTVIVVSTVIFFLVFFYALDLGITALKNLLFG